MESLERKGAYVMEFSIETTYDQKALTAMVRALRKTLGRKRSRRTRNFGIFAILLGLILCFSAVEINFRLIVTMLIVLIILLALLFQDPINAYFTRKAGLPGMEKAVVTFRETGYHSQTALGESDFRYDTIRMLADTGDYWVFAFSPRHGQVYEKKTLSGGTPEEFQQFLQEKTGIKMLIV